MKHPLILLLLPVLLVGCSTYSKRDCLEMDWYLEGKKAALDGFTPKQGKTHLIDKCQEDQGVAVEFVEFGRGFTSGLTKLCTPEGRKTLEERGIKYQGTCEMHEDSLGLQKSRSIELEEKIHGLETEVTRLKAENAKLAAEVEALKSKSGAAEE